MATYYPSPYGSYYNFTASNNVTFATTTGSRVGIGTTTTPGEKLEVNGNIKLSGASATYRITNVADPVVDQDVATRAYVLAAAGGPGNWNCTIRSATGPTSPGATAYCVTPEKLISGGCLYNFPQPNAIAGTPVPGQGYNCQSTTSIYTVTTYANCCK